MELTIDYLLAHDIVELFWRQIGFLAKLLVLTLLATTLAVAAVISAVRSYRYREVSEPGFALSIVACLTAGFLVYFAFFSTRYSLHYLMVASSVLPAILAAFSLLISVDNLRKPRPSPTARGSRMDENQKPLDPQSKSK